MLVFILIRSKNIIFKIFKIYKIDGFSDAVYDFFINILIFNELYFFEVISCVVLK